MLFADNEEEKELDTDTPATREKVGTHSRHACMHETGKTYISGMQIHFDLGVLFFFHADDPELMQKYGGLICSMHDQLMKNLI